GGIHTLRRDVTGCRLTCDSEHAKPMHVSEGVFYFPQLRRGSQLQGRIASLDGKSQLLAGANAHDSLHIGESSDRGAVDCGYHIADLEARRRRGTARLHLIYARRRARLAQE